MEAAQVSISRWVDKTTWYIYTMEYYSTVKKKKILLFGTAWMDLEHIMLSEISQSEKDIWVGHSYVEANEKSWTNKQNRDRLIDREQADSSEELEGSSEKEKGLMHMDNSVVNVGGGR